MEQRDSLDELRSSAQMSSRSASTPFLRLVDKGDCAAVAAALAANPSLACDRDYYANTALHLAAAQRNLPLVQLLLACEGTDVDAQEGVHKRTACHIVASSGASDILAALIARGAHTEPRNNVKETAAHKAARHARFDCLELLIASGAALDAQDELGRTPLMRACETGSLECTKLLIVGHAKLDQLDSFGRTAVHVCAMRGKLLCLRALLQNGADPFRVDQSNRSAADLARSLGHHECAAELDKFCATVKASAKHPAARVTADLLSTPIDEWSVAACGAWAASQALGPAVCAAFARHDVCGRVLLGVTEPVLRDDMQIASWGARKKALDAIERLVARYTEEKEAAKNLPAGQGAKVILYEELEMGELLGVGNFGEVKRANWRGTNVAVKVIYRKTLFHDKDHRALFAQEVAIISQLHHPNIVQFIGTCQSVPEGHFCLVTEFCGGGSLRQLIAENGAALQRANLRARIARDVCRAAVHLHKWKPPILHRDLTSSNLLLDHALTAKLADFGLSRESFRDRTLTGGFGAVAWMDPVVLKGGVYTTASDVYSFGMCCYEMVALQVPHAGMAALRFAEMVARGHRPALPANAPPDWHAIITQCWSSDPANRPTFVELLQRIEVMAAQPGNNVPSPTAPRQDAPANYPTSPDAPPHSTEALLGPADADGYING